MSDSQLGPVRRVAALYDIHGNLPALDAVLAEVEDAEVDLIVVGGDVLPGPIPREALVRLRELAPTTRFIRGNGEGAVLDQRAGREPPVPKEFRPIIEYCANALDVELERWITSWPATIRVEIAGLGQVLFCHATPRNDTEVFTRLTPEDRLRPIFEGLGVSTAICGHTHMQFDRMVGAVRVVNAGSVGMPFGEPGAFWLLLGPTVELRRTEYDRTAAADRIRATSYPQAAQFAEGNILQPPSEAVILEGLSRAELR
jgi:predicted phosphodiesterase